MLFSNIMGLLGGLALFLYGMQMMSTGLEAAAGNKMKVILAKLTANRFVGVLVGVREELNVILRKVGEVLDNKTVLCILVSHLTVKDYCSIFLKQCNFTGTCSNINSQ